LNKGKVLCEAIDNTLLSSPEMTAKWEAYLKKIGEGNGSQEVFLNQIQQFIEKMIQDIQQQMKESKTIKTLINEAKEKNNIENYKKDNYQNMVKELCEKRKTKKLKGFKSKKGKNKTFDTTLVFDEEYNIKFDFGKNKKTHS